MLNPQTEALTGAGASALALIWLVVLAPKIARAVGAWLRQGLANDIEATRNASADDLMPSVLSTGARRWAGSLLATAWATGFVVLCIRGGVSSWTTPTLAAFSVFFAVLFVATLIDLDTQLLPGPLVGAILWAGILAALFEWVPLPLEKAVLGAAAGWALFSLPCWMMTIARASGQPAIGAGDIHLLAACGAWLGPVQVIVAGCLAVIAALVVRAALAAHTSWRQDPHGQLRQPPAYLPFGPLISLASIAILCFDPFHHLWA